MFGQPTSQHASHNELSDSTRNIESLLRGDLQINTVFQAIVDLQQGDVAGYEALSRMPQQMMLAPDRALEIAHVMGMRAQLEEVMLRSIIDHIPQLPPNKFLAMNLSPTFFISEQFLRILDEMGNLGGLVFEVTEQDIINDYRAFRLVRDRIRFAGGSVAVDDTGAGYASLKHVMELRPDFIKLDRLFVKDCHKDPSKGALIQMLGETADRLDAWLVAEGIESEEEANELVRLGIPLAQGYFFGTPREDAFMADHPELSRLQKPQVELLEIRTLQPFVESCATAVSIEAAEVVLSEGFSDVVVVLDRWRRPNRIVSLKAQATSGVGSSLMRVQLGTDPKECLVRALTRPSPGCFEPLLVVSKEGTFEGIVRVERLMRAQLTKRPARTNATVTPIGNSAMAPRTSVIRQSDRRDLRMSVA